MKPRIGVIGGGVYGAQVIKTYYTAHREGLADFVAVCDINRAVLDDLEKKYGIKGYQDYKEMVEAEKLDGVAIVTPDYLHREIAAWCAGKGVHMLVQKPLDTTTAGAREMVEAANRNGVMMFVDFHKRYDPGHIQLKNDIAAGKLGKLQYGYVCMEDVIMVPSVWFKSWAQHSSPVWFLGVHFYDLICWLMDSKPVEVYATGVKHKLISMGIDTYDSIQAKFKFENGASFAVDTSWILPNSFTAVVNQQIRVAGSEGMEEVDSQDRGLMAAFSSSPSAVQANPYGKLEVEDMVYGGTRLMGYTLDSMIHFLKLLRLVKEGRPVAELKKYFPTGEQAVVSTRMCEAVHESVESGKIVRMNL
ncbi:MAG: Gfo/Idh/MocA family oxidoreductase [Clostridiales bacterium]|nr:Gfo/Idh/MocA family oxidoreductase [Clostridiales bacterium]